MGFLDAFRNTFNLAGTKITIVTERQEYCQGDIIRGTVYLRGGEVEQRADTLTLKLQEYWTENDTDDDGHTSERTVTNTVQSRKLAWQLTIAPGSEQRYDFEMRLPINCRLSNSDEGWFLRVKLDVALALDPKHYIEFQVRPAREFEAIVQTFERELRFMEQYRHRNWHERHLFTRFRLRPPGALAKELDYLRLRLRQDGRGGVVGDIQFDLQEKSVKDYFKALVAADDVSRPISLTYQELFAPHWKPRYRELASTLMALIEEVILERKGLV